MRLVITVFQKRQLRVVIRIVIKGQVWMVITVV